jgi:hypothetical protein
MTRNKLARFLVALVLAFGGFALTQTVTASPAQADPGSCAVRHATDFDGWRSIYVVRNQCGASIRVRIYLGSSWPLSCQTVPARGYATWTSLRYYPNWYIRSC